ncbi:SpoIVB peptidase [Pueribacillus sp. YX66]|uniref:SpoIVB peptidase n=1 Tax=Pueribacillus sp. YX66 TaxID=3229242 RepID=UPI00358D7640
MKMKKMRKMIGIVLLSFLIVIAFIKPFQSFLKMPNDIRLFQNGEMTFSNLPVNTKISSAENKTTLSSERFSNKAHTTVKAIEPGQDSITVHAGNFPVKKMAVNVLPDLRVKLGGQSVGVKLNTHGVLVVGHHLIDTKNGESSPGEKAGIEIGDVITKINGKEIKQMTDLAPYIEKAGNTGGKLHLTVLRDNKQFEKTIKPVKDLNENSYRIGLYIRDSAAGVGTLTFYHPESKKYGALGHVISDMDTKKPIIVNNGQILSSSVSSIEKSSNGNPGEKVAQFTNEKPLGTITKNSPFGIFGKLDKTITNGVHDNLVPVALPYEVKEGPAKILTVLEGDKVEEFDIEIVSSVNQKFPATKGMVIKIKDPKLLEKTGGIVQGMSGSPIIQNGKLVGAVTHVFVNDSTSGYGVHIEWMLKEAGIDINEREATEKRMAS